MRRLSIIIPAWNEEGRIGRTLREYINYFSGKYGYDFEVTVVMDGCTDRTPKIVEEFSRKYPQVKYLIFPKRIGKGGGIIEGFKVAAGDVVAFTDADGAAEPKELDKLIGTVQDYDAAIGSRWMDGSAVILNQPFSRRVASRGFNLMIRLLFGLPFKDTQCGAKALKSHVVRDVISDLGLTNFAFDIDLLYRLMKRGYKVKEAPLAWAHDKNSKLNLRKVVPTMFLSVIGLRIKTSSLRRLVPKRLENWLYNRLKEA